jgi:peptidyl-tRNA hydrolase, PTH2 family
VPEDAFTHKLVIVTRRNLKLSAGKLAAQVAHAAVTCALRAQEEDPRTFKKWMSEGQKKVVVKVESEKEFYPLKEAAEDFGLATSLIQDAGHTEIPAGTVTVLGIGPGPNERIDRITGELPLL